MSGAAVLAAEAGEEHAVLRMAVEVPWPKEEPAFTAVATAAFSLLSALVAFEQHPGAGKAARSARAADHLIRQMNAHCGPGWGEAR